MALRTIRWFLRPFALPMHSFRNAVLTCAALLATAACSKAITQAAADQIAASGSEGSAHAGAFVVQLGADTIVVEKFSRSGANYSVEQALRRRPHGCFTRTSSLMPAPHHG